MVLKPRDKKLNDILMRSKGGAHELDETHKSAKRARQKRAWKKEVRMSGDD